jgi:hypothetical protein
MIRAGLCHGIADSGLLGTLDATRVPQPGPSGADLMRAQAPGTPGMVMAGTTMPKRSQISAKRSVVSPSSTSGHRTQAIVVQRSMGTCGRRGGWGRAPCVPRACPVRAGVGAGRGGAMGRGRGALHCRGCTRSSVPQRSTSIAAAQANRLQQNKATHL